MALGMLDLSIVTDRLLKLLRNCIDASRLWEEEPTPPEGTPPGIDPGLKFDIALTGEPPDAIRNGEGCQLSLYLFYVTPDRFQRNVPVKGAPLPKSVKELPLGLDLHYLLTAYSEGNYIQEQQAMSIALKCFHENPIVRAIVPADPTHPREFCLTMEVESADELGQFWQSTTVSYRLSVIYRVSVIFLEPEPPDQRPAFPVEHVALAVAPTASPLADVGLLLGTSTGGGLGAPSAPEKALSLQPAVVVSGQSFLLYGAKLSLFFRLYLFPSGGPEQDITGWIAPEDQADWAAGKRDTRVHLVVPVGGPAPGVYLLRAGDALPLTDPNAIRSNATPLCVAAWVDPGADPILTSTGATYTLQGSGFASGEIVLFLDTIPLTQTSGTLAEGTFQITPTTVDFQAPADLRPGKYAVRVRVNAIEALPVKWIVLP